MSFDGNAWFFQWKSCISSNLILFSVDWNEYLNGGYCGLKNMKFWSIYIQSFSLAALNAFHTIEIQF